MIGPRRLASRPWQLGLLVYLVLVLTSSLLAAPWVAAGLEFGHWHPQDEPPHLHEMTGILAGAVSAAVVAVTVAFVVFRGTVPRLRQAYSQGVLHPARAIRAPPAGG